MRIVHLLSSPVWSGPAETIAELALAQRRLGHDVTVAIDRLRQTVTSEEPAAPRFLALGLLAETRLELCVHSSPLGMWRDALALRAWPGDVVHTHFSHDHFLASACGKRLARSIYAPRSLRWSLPPADAYTLCQETTLRRVLHKPHMILPPLVGNAFQPSPDRQALRQQLGIAGEPLVLMASTFQPSRRHSLALTAFSLLRAIKPGAELFLLGDGALEPDLRQQAAGLGINVAFVGYKTGDAFVRYLQACDQLWVLGLGNDFSGRIAAQARACGAQVIAVAEGQLLSFANAVVPLSSAAIAKAAEEPPDKLFVRPDSIQVAKAVLELYNAAQSRSVG